MKPSEEKKRSELGIPKEAQRVLIFGESSHWDPNWLSTSEEYYQRNIQRNLDFALHELQAEPQRIYSVECMFFFRMYWERNPANQARMRELVNTRRLRFTGSGVTTADTILPSPEAILRDMYLGQEWLRKNGMHQEPRLAYFTDSFGVSPFLPSLLLAAGFDQTAITRVDGMFFGGADLETGRRFPLAGSTASFLSKEARSTDFIWRDPNGAEVLCHWNAFGYGQGDMLAYQGLFRIFNKTLGRYNPTVKRITNRIEKYARQLTPLAKTPYIFCPIGFDFNGPIPRLTEILKLYNTTQFPSSGIWVVNAGLDDYLALVEAYWSELPVIQLDPNPYWTGFYTSRPALKKRCRVLVDRLLLAERLSAQISLAAPERTPAENTQDRLSAAWWDAATANHHDFITGTSPDRVVAGEQEVMLDRATQQVNATLLALQAQLSGKQIPTPEPNENLWTTAKLTVQKQPGLLAIASPKLSVLLEEATFDINHLVVAGYSYLHAKSHHLVNYHDSGGLWRMGHEYRGGYLKEASTSMQVLTPLALQATQDGKVITDTVEIGGEKFQRYVWLFDEHGILLGRITGRAPRQHTVCVRWHTPALADTFTMGAAGGVTSRPLEKIYSPTFWPVQDFAHLQFRDKQHGLAVFIRYPAALACNGDGSVDLVAFRNATGERAYGLIPIPATPANGYEQTGYTFDYALFATTAGDWQANHLDQIVFDLMPRLWEKIDNLPTQVGAPVEVARQNPNDRSVKIVTVKPASRSTGWIVRLGALAAPADDIILQIPGHSIRAAWLCDARERDLQALSIEGGQVKLKMTGPIATIRLII